MREGDFCGVDPFSGRIGGCECIVMNEVLETLATAIGGVVKVTRGGGRGREEVEVEEEV